MSLQHLAPPCFFAAETCFEDALPARIDFYAADYCSIPMVARTLEGDLRPVRWVNAEGSDLAVLL